jgi:hypothetical protein
MRTCATLLNYYSSLPSKDRLDQEIYFYGACPAIVARAIGGCYRECKAAIAEYRNRGIDPQAHTLKDMLSHSRKAVETWRSKAIELELAASDGTPEAAVAAAD